VLCVGGVKYFQIAHMQADLIEASRAQQQLLIREDCPSNSREAGIGM